VQTATPLAQNQTILQCDGHHTTLTRRREPTS
jgi:hypothetical protein